MCGENKAWRWGAGRRDLGERKGLQFKVSHSSGDVPRLGSGGSGDAAGERSADLIAVCSEPAMGYCRQDASEHRPKNSKVHQKEHVCVHEWCVCVCHTRVHMCIHNINKKGS